MDDKWNFFTADIDTFDPPHHSHPGKVPVADGKVCPRASGCDVWRRLATTQELMRIGDWEYEVATGNSHWSRQMFVLLGRDPFSGRFTFEEFLFNYTPDDAARLQKTLDSAIRDNERREIEVAAKLIHGEGTRHRLIFVPLTDHNGIVTRVNGYLQDISLLKPEKPAGPSPNHRVRFVAVNTSDVVFRVSLPDVAYEFISAAVQDVTGYSPLEWYRNPLLIREILHPGWRGKFDREFKKVLSGKIEDCHVFPILHKSGETHWIQLRTTLLRDSHGVLLAIEGIASDITDRKRQEGERKRLIRQLRKALSEVKTLSGLLPICSHCKKVRDDKGYWQQIDAFITEHSDLFFSHGLCPECLARHYPEYACHRSSGK
jgi:PAS domain S-box-containing protein